ncbi:MAG: DUF6515 family protein [Deltaproteobacteria bacterium]
MLLITSTEAFAWGWERSIPRRHESFRARGRTYYYDHDRFYLPFFNLGFFIVAPPIGAVVSILPAGHRTIVVGGLNYYYYDNVYYRPCPTGYIVVPRPVMNSNVAVVPTPESYGQTVTINIPNSNGSYTAVTLTRRGNGYVGPQGEYYSGRPTVDQLRALYGN